jgi:hypothetical protein
MVYLHVSGTSARLSYMGPADATARLDVLALASGAATRSPIPASANPATPALRKKPPRSTGSPSPKRIALSSQLLDYETIPQPGPRASAVPLRTGSMYKGMVAGVNSHMRKICAPGSNSAMLGEWRGPPCADQVPIDVP